MTTDDPMFGERALTPDPGRAPVYDAIRHRRDVPFAFRCVCCGRTNTLSLTSFLSTYQDRDQVLGPDHAEAIREHFQLRADGSLADGWPRFRVERCKHCQGAYLVYVAVHEPANGGQQVVPQGITHLPRCDAAASASPAPARVAPTRTPLLLTALALSGLGAGGLYIGSDPTRGLPDERALVAAEGAVTWHAHGKHDVRFTLTSPPGNFVYLSKGNAADQVAAALDRADGAIVRVLYSPGETSGPIHDQDRYATVYAVSVDGRPVRTYQQVAEAWSADNRFGWYAGIGLLVAGLGFVVAGIRQPRRAAAGHRPSPLR